MFEKLDRLITTVDNFKYHKFSVLCERILKSAIAHLAEGELTLLPKYQTYFLTSEALKKYFKKYNEEGIPFENYADQPIYVKNLKDLLNAIYLLQKTFEDVESVDIREGDHKIFTWDEPENSDEASELSNKPFWKRWWYKAIGSAGSVYNSSGEANRARKLLWTETVPKAYQACLLLTHLDFSILSSFVPEYESLLKGVQQLKQLGEQAQAYTEITPDKIQDWIQPDQLGTMAGIGLYHLKSDGGSLDIGFLTQLSGRLPYYFQQLTDQLNQWSPDLAQVESSVSKEQFDAFQELAEKILVATDRLKNRNTLLLPLYVMQYIRLLQDIISLSRGVVEHFSLANETSKDVVIEKLRKLKQEYIGTSFLLLDKTEAELMLKPGTLSEEWMPVMENFWAVLSRYANNVIDLHEKAPDLLSLNDYALLERRLKVLENRMDANKAAINVNFRKVDACTRFYEKLRGLASQTSVTQDELTQLAEYYLLIQKFFIATKPKLHATLVENFFSEQAIRNHNNEPHGFIGGLYQSYMPFVVSWAKCKSELLAIEGEIKDTVQSSLNTLLLNKKIAQDIHKNLDKTPNLPLIPWQSHPVSTPEAQNDELTQVYINFYEAQREFEHVEDSLDHLSEFESFLKRGLNANIFHLNDLSALERRKGCDLHLMSELPNTSDQYLNSYLYVRKNDAQKLYYVQFDGEYEKAEIKNIHLFEKQINSLKSKDESKLYLSEHQIEEFITSNGGHTPKKLSNLYASLQPYFYMSIEKAQKNSWIHFDRKMIQALSGNIVWLPNDKTVLPITDVLNKLSFFEFQQQLNDHKELLTQKIKHFKETYRSKINQCKEELQYVEPRVALERANYVFKWEFVPKIPQWINQQRHQLFEWVQKNYSHAITSELINQSTTGVPYPDIEDPLIRLSQPHQLVVIKQILNALYYLEFSSQQLAELREDSYQSTYVFNLFQAYQGFEQIYELSLALHGDPYLRAFLIKLQEQVKQIQQTTVDHIHPYQTSSLELEPQKQQPIQWSALWYTVQTLKVLPNHIQTQVDGKPLEDMARYRSSYSAKQTCLEIEDLLSKSDSYVRTFLSLPRISRLTYQLRDECLSLGQQINETVISHLKSIHDGPMTDILIKADELEIEIGLQSGTISEPIRQILSKYYTELVYQQHLPSSTTFDILYSQYGRQRRISSIINRRENFKQQIIKRDEALKMLNPVMQYLYKAKENFNEISSNDISRFASWLMKNFEILKDWEEENNLSANVPRYRQTKFEKEIFHLAAGLKESFPNFDFRIRRLYAKLTGEKASIKFSIRKQDHQLSFLTVAEQYPAIIQKEQTEQMKRYIELQFYKIAKPFKRRTIGIANLSGEDYRSRFKTYIQAEMALFRDEICAKPLCDLVNLDLVQLTEAAAKKSVNTFVESHFDDYVLLCGFLNQLQKCKEYCQGLSVNETNVNKQEKYNQFLSLLDELEINASEQSLTPAQRIRNLKIKTSKSSAFYRRLMDIRNDAEPFTWLWLKQCIEDLLAFLYLRTPTRQRHYDDICGSLENPNVSLQQLYKANGFFKLNESMPDSNVEQHHHVGDDQPNVDEQPLRSHSEAATSTVAVAG